MSTELMKIDFQDDQIVAFKDDDKIYVNIKGICTSLGLDFSSQRKKLLSDPTYSKSLSRGDITTVKGERESLFLDSDLLQGWLFSIQTNRLKPDIRAKHILYKRECFKVLNDYFTKGIAINQRGDALSTLTDRVDEIEARLSRQAPSLHQDKVREGILKAVSGGEKSTSQLYDFFNRHVDAKNLHTVLNQLIQEELICTRLQFAIRRGKPTSLYSQQVTFG